MEKIQGCGARWESLLSGRGLHLSFSEREVFLSRKNGCKINILGSGGFEDYRMIHRWLKEVYEL